MKRVLIVDDAIDLGRLLQDAVKTAHPEVPILVVPSAEEALLEFSRLTVDLLITDIRLPGMSGLELILEDLGAPAAGEGAGDHRHCFGRASPKAVG